MFPPGNDSSDTLGEPFPSGTEEDLRQEPLGGFDLGSLREQATGNTTAHPPLTYEERAQLSPQVLTISYRARYSEQMGAIPDEHELHHVVPQAVARRSDLIQEAIRRGIYNVDRVTNLVPLPSSEDAYNESEIKIRHRDRHDKWSAHAKSSVDRLRDRLLAEYGALDSPDLTNEILTEELQNLENRLLDNLLDIPKGIEGGWIRPANPDSDYPGSTNRLSTIDNEVEIT